MLPSIYLLFMKLTKPFSSFVNTAQLNVGKRLDHGQHEKGYHAAKDNVP